ncbi:CWC16 protein [Chaetomidium leptoderma]|uniref:CWC16 protein n=1 Tax=Chaetomidium leptoderma TaxID=669021 RepID=A0AAN6ZSK6_9PEZI|nr:CWC16 protein [Chaetomidium leptoderma]
MQGFNMGRYIPPDAHGSVTSGNALHHKKHALGARAAKLASHGILVVRFEMPFAIWCATCPAPTTIGQGVRFNAEKRRAGAYYSTPIWSFTLKHAACGGVIEMRTDPKNAEFVVVSGARRRDYGQEDGEEEEGGGSLVKTTGTGGFVITTERERAEQRESAFGKLEKTIADREQVAGATRRIGELHDAVDRQWDDPYTANRRLRQAFRVGRHVREAEAARTEELKERMGLGIELLPETEEDARRARLVDFGSLDAAAGDVGVDKALARPLFGSVLGGQKEKREDDKAPAQGKRKLKSEIAASRTRDNLVSEIVSNTRASKDPFLDFGSKESTPRGPVLLPGLKRKRPAEETPYPRPPAAEQEVKEDKPKDVVGTTALVNYDSDSD